MINFPHAVTLGALLDRRAHLADYLMEKDTLEEVIAFHDAEKNKTNVVLKVVALVSSSDI